MKRFSRTAWTLLGLTVLALGLRLVNIGVEPYWGDEILSLDIARHFTSMGEMARYLSEVEFHPPLYYFLLWPWIRIFGEMEASTRALSVIFSIGTVPLTWWAGKRMFRDGRAALVASALVAVMPMMVEFGQEARPYAIQAFFITISLVSLWTYLEKRTRGWALAYAVTATIALYLHYSTFFFIGAAMGWWLIALVRERPKMRTALFMDALLAHAVLFILFFPWLTPFLYKLLLGKVEIFGLMREIPEVRPPLFFEHSFHQLLWVTKGKFVTKPEVAARLLAVLAIGIGAVIALQKRKEGSIWKGPGTYLSWITVVSLTLFLFSPQSIAYSSIHHRHVIFLAIPVALLLGSLASSLDRKKRIVLLAVLLVSFVPPLTVVLGDDSEWDRNYRYKEAGTYISEQYREGDLVIISISTVRTDLSHYLDPHIPVETVVPYPHFGNDEWATRETLGLMENEAQVRLMRIASDIGGTSTGSGEVGLTKEKITRLIERHDPERVWLYAFSPYAPAHDWFLEREWRHPIRQIGGLFRVDLYEAPSDNPVSP